MIQQILSQAASIFLLIGLGLLAARTKIFPEDGTDVLCRLQLNVVTPVMILVTMQGHTFAGQLAMDTLWSFLSYGLTVATVGLLSFPLVRLLRLGEEDQGVCRIQLAFKNIGFMGIPPGERRAGPAPRRRHRADEHPLRRPALLPGHGPAALPPGLPGLQPGLPPAGGEPAAGVVPPGHPGAGHRLHPAGDREPGPHPGLGHDGPSGDVHRGPAAERIS